MAWLVRDKNTEICLILKYKPIRKNNRWDFPDNKEINCEDFEAMHINSVKNIFGIEPKWENEPVEIVPAITNIEIEYDGTYPNLCSGHLIVIINNVKYDFGTGCLISGGSCNWCSENSITKGPWNVDFPEDFPEIYKQAVLEKINEEIPQGCCGGCL